MTLIQCLGQSCGEIFLSFGGCYLWMEQIFLMDCSSRYHISPQIVCIFFSAVVIQISTVSPEVEHTFSEGRETSAISPNQESAALAGECN